jgi:hypothetical protein
VDGFGHGPQVPDHAADADRGGDVDGAAVLHEPRGRAGAGRDVGGADERRQVRDRQRPGGRVAAQHLVQLR